MALQGQGLPLWCAAEFRRYLGLTHGGPHRRTGCNYDTPGSAHPGPRRAGGARAAAAARPERPFAHNSISPVCHSGLHHSWHPAAPPGYSPPVRRDEPPGPPPWRRYELVENPTHRAIGRKHNPSHQMPGTASKPPQRPPALLARRPDSAPHGAKPLTHVPPLPNPMRPRGPQYKGGRRNRRD